MSRLEKTQLRKITDKMINNITAIRTEQKSVITANRSQKLLLGLCKMEYTFSNN